MSNQSSKLYRNDKPLRDVVSEQLREQIYSGSLPPGTRLVERALAETFSVSRLPVREALRVILSEGLVENLASRGVVVRRLDEQQVIELFDIREALEVLAVKRATARVAAGTPNPLPEILDRARAALDRDDLDAAHAANSDFHDQLVVLAGNNLLETMIEPLLGRLHWLFRQISDSERLMAEHQTLGEAIASGDTERAGALARAHVLTYRAHTMAFLFDA